MSRLWIGHWFSTAYHFVHLLKHNPDKRNFKVFGSSHNRYCPVLLACDQVLPEPENTGEAYAHACLETCQRWQIEIFVPGYKRFAEIGPYLEEFKRQGVRVMLPDWPLLRLLHDKVETYRSAAGLVPLPAYRLASTAQDFADAYAELSGQGHTVCVKPNQAQGGMGFRILEPSAPGLESLYGYPSCSRADFQAVYEILRGVQNFPPLLLSEYLRGPEYSVDCLACDGHLYAAVPRHKISPRLCVLEDQRELIELAKTLSAHFRLPHLFNIQFKYQDNTPKLLEINPRMSGGLYMSCMAGVNLPYLAVKLLLGETIEIPPLRLDVKVGEVGQAVLFNDPR